MPLSPTLVLATLATRQFSFSAIGHTEAEAIAGIERAWAVHRQQAGHDRALDMPLPHWPDLAEEFEARLLPMMAGQGYRDYEQITS
ncbi:MAG: hypothetical protein Q7S87_01270 [Agitococcus sp.]|nr:hypothetical protein [Agitococcus sp.]MDO9179156.1 hypothetical protein [Agitococcus sp.]